MRLLTFLLATLLCMSTIEATSELAWLKTQGTRFVDDKGHAVVLRSVNLGGWLAEEMWMLPIKKTPPINSPFKPVQDHASLWSTLGERFGQKKMQHIRTAFRNAWLTEKDFKIIRESGFNCVRLPFLYDLIHEPEGLFYWLDHAVTMAKNEGLYVVLDMHGAPGRQSSEQHTGEKDQNRLFHDAAMVQKTGDIWMQIARHYKDCPTVAGYDLLNEPMGAPDSATLYLVQDQLYRWIRSVDARHIVFIEDGFKGIARMPYPTVAGWDNVALSTHAYAFEAKSEEESLQILLKQMGDIRTHQAVRNAPFYVGEFNVKPVGSPLTIRSFIASLETHGISWALWTYKLAASSRKPSIWGLYSPQRRVSHIDPYTDSEADILKKIEQLRTEHLKLNRELADAVKAAIYTQLTSRTGYKRELQNWEAYER